MILKQEVEIGENETTGELWNKLASIGGNLLVQTLEQIENGTAKREKQTGKRRSVAVHGSNENAGDRGVVEAERHPKGKQEAGQ